MKNKNILIVEDEHITAMEVQAMLEEMEYDVVDVVDTAEQAFNILEERNVDVIIMDIRLSGELDGIEATAKIKENYDLPVIYFSAYSDDKTLERARNTEPDGFLIKPITSEDLQSTIEVVG